MCSNVPALQDQAVIPIMFTTIPERDLKLQRHPASDGWIVMNCDYAMIVDGITIFCIQVYKDFRPKTK